MKYLLVFIGVILLVWRWRHMRGAAKNEWGRARLQKNSFPINTAAEIVACKICQVHLPRAEAWEGEAGIYCSDSHRRLGG